MKFDWDEFENIENQEKHGISFDEAKKLFYMRYELKYDCENSTLGEDRYIAAGFVDGLGVVMVVHCERDEDTIRIISARKA
jgi:uncharacterized DUF497 family protein